jgi:hypothetical protein
MNICKYTGYQLRICMEHPVGVRIQILTITTTDPYGTELIQLHPLQYYVLKFHSYGHQDKNQ